MKNRYCGIWARKIMLTAGIALALAVCATPVLAQKSNVANREVPTDVTALRMTYDAGKQQVVFEGGVKVVRPDFELDADRLIIYLKSKPKAAESAQEEDPLAGMSGGDSG